MRDFVRNHAPISFQNAAISLYNWRQWQQRRAGVYADKRRLFSESASWDEPRWASAQSAMLENFLAFAVKNAPWYRRHAGAALQDFPILTKTDLVQHLDRIRTLPDRDGLVSHTGGTTGASLKVVYRHADVQTRFAMLDWFRAQHGWRLGARTAWFSGKPLVRDGDIERGVVWRDDWITRTRFFSTFHVNEHNFYAYWKGLIDFDPEFIVGFPSSVCEILAMAKARGLHYPSRVKVFFPTAETVLSLHRELAAEMLGCVTRDQYASSEGAPFILECCAGRLHLMPLSGHFEVVDDDLRPARSGELLVTSFTTHGTPLIRYSIGDHVTLAEPGSRCGCGWSFPMVESIDGRSSDFVWSPDFGRVNLGNLSNATKGIPGIIAFQIVQDKPDEIRIFVQATAGFSVEGRETLLAALRQRTGPSMRISLEATDQLSRETSGKLRFVKSSLKAEQMVLR